MPPNWSHSSGCGCVLAPHDIDAAVRHTLTSVLERTGYDFGDYQRPFVIRRLRRVAQRHDMVGDLTELAARVDEQAATLVPEIVASLSIGVTEMFRDPSFWLALRTQVLPELPELRDRAPVRAWVAGCASGEEAYSLAIAMRESHLGDRVRIYATDIDEAGLSLARAGRLDRQAIEVAERNYHASGGTGSFADYLEPDGATLTLDRSMFVFARHNLVTDASFNTFDIVLCRNVLIYFNLDLHRRVHETLFDSLTPGGVLGLGARESHRASAHRDELDIVDRRAHLYRRRR